MEKPGRLEDLLRLVLWEGRLQNSRLRELFGLRVVRASQLIQAFRTAFPDALRWDAKRRAFLATPSFWNQHKKKVGAADPLALDRYLAIVGVAAGFDEGPLVLAHRDLAAVRPAVFAHLHACIVEGSWTRLTYRSMSHPAPHERTVHPTALVRAGSRWHVRAFTEETASWRDYNLGRIVRFAEAAAPRAAVPADVAWEARVPVRLVPHPALSADHEDVVRLEYMAGTASRVETCRGALVPYLVQEFRAAVHPQREQPPEYLLAVHNLKDVERWLWT